ATCMLPAVRCPENDHDRRTFLGILTVGLAATVAGCSSTADPGSGGARLRTRPVAPPVNLPPIPQPQPGQAQVISKGLPGSRKICLTVDDGDCSDCVAGYVQFAQRTGIHLT